MSIKSANVREATKKVNPSWDWLGNFGDLCNSTKKLGVSDDTVFIGYDASMSYVTDRYGRQIMATRVC